MNTIFGSQEAAPERAARLSACLESLRIASYREAQDTLRRYAYADTAAVAPSTAPTDGNGERVLYLFAGPNGSGKSTLLAGLYAAEEGNGLAYVCPDIYASGRFAEVTDVYERYSRAIAYAAEQRDALLAAGRSLVMETVLSRADKLDFVAKARRMGYRVVAVFVATASADINCERVRRRVAEGGHDVPEDKLRARYARSLDNLALLARYADELYVCDNSGARHTLALAVVGGETVWAADAPAWVRERMDGRGAV